MEGKKSHLLNVKVKSEQAFYLVYHFKIFWFLFITVGYEAFIMHLRNINVQSLAQPPPHPPQGIYSFIQPAIRIM